MASAQVSREYAVFLATEVGGSSNAQYDYPRPLLAKAFEHLVALGLVSATREGRGRTLPTDQVPVRLIVDPSVIRDYVATATWVPDRIRRFCGSLTV